MKFLQNVCAAGSTLKFLARGLSRRALVYCLGTLTLCVLPFSFAAAANSSAEGDHDAVQFNQDIRPILSDNCFQCHGYDAENRKADLRLDTPEGIVADLGGYQAVVPGDLERSELYKRIIHSDPEERMPPLKSHKILSTEQIEKLAGWINAGAPWEDHWSFEPIKSPEAPAVSKPQWVRNPIDAFILKRLDKEQLIPSQEAAPHTLVRRVSLDLTGMPPSPEVVAAFVADSSGNHAEDAYENLVDSLLASPAFGEHRANYWLDAARYADTHGLHLDNYRSIWPYRDWVVNAFNDNQPFDQFTVEQLAGDMLPGSTLKQKVATGFNRSNPTTSEGGAIDDEYLAIYAKDRAETTAAVWMGLTVGCATCHDHKFDPISQKEFYQFTAFFRNTTQPAMDGNSIDSRPYISVPRAQDVQKKVQLEDQLTQQIKAFQQARKNAEGEMTAWLSGGSQHGINIPVAKKNLELAMPLAGAKRLVVETAKGEHTLTAQGYYSSLKGVVGKALQLGEHAYVNLGDYGKFSIEDAFSGSVWIKPAKGGEGVGPILDYRIYNSDVERKNNSSDAGWRFEHSGSVLRLKVQTGNMSRLQVETSSDELANNFKQGEWNHIAFSYNGNGSPNGIKFYVNGELLKSGGDSSAVSSNNSPLLRAVDSNSRSGMLTLGDRVKEKTEEQTAQKIANKDQRTIGLQDLRLFRGVLNVEQIHMLENAPQLKRAAKLEFSMQSEQQRSALLNYYYGYIDRKGKEALEKFTALRLSLNEIDKNSAVTLVMEEKSDSQPSAHILDRGLYDHPKEKVDAGVPAIFKPLTDAMPPNRLSLAQWLVDPEHPLMSRVTVNRFWQSLFGTGLVATAGDFGSQGEPPSHPLLLDWLASEFMKNNWNVKQFFKLMVMSSTYRQSSQFTPELLAKDEDNRLLARGPRFRLGAEAIRDQALFVSGLLVDKRGGPAVKPYQPDGVWKTVAYVNSNTATFKQDHGENLYRKSLYTFRKRTAAPPSMNIFDAPSREACGLKRELTNSPLQALLLMNDPQFLEAARHLAQRILLATNDDGDSNSNGGKYYWLLKTALGREPDQNMISVLQETHETVLDIYRGDREAAAQLIRIGESPADASLDEAELAAWTMVASQVMNMDEFISKN